MNDPHQGDRGPPGLPRVRLVRDGQRRAIVRAATDTGQGDPDAGDDAASAFDPFPLPPLPLSQHCWLTGFAAEFRRRHQRCVAALLILDCRSRRWVRPLVPAQACGRDGACWTLNLGTGPRPPRGGRVAGSFQTRLARGLFEAAATVPPLDGLHVVQAGGGGEGRGGEDWSVYTFLRLGGQTSVVPPDDLMVDDWDQALAKASGRMRFE